MATATRPAARLDEGPPPPPGSSGGIYFGYYIVGAALVAQFIAIGAQASVSGVFLDPMNEELGWTKTEFTLAQTINRFLMAFAGVWIGVYVDRLGGRPVMLVGTVILSASLFSVSFVEELWQWLLLRGVIFALGAAMVGNLVVNVTLSKWFVDRRGRAIAVAAMGVSLAGVVWPPLMNWTIDLSDWRGGWQAMSVIALVVLLPASLFMRRTPEDYGLHPDGHSDEAVRQGAGDAAAADFRNSFTRAEALRTRAFYIVVFAFGLGGAGIGVILLHTVPFLSGDDGTFSRTQATSLSALMSLLAFAAKPFWGFLTDKFEPKYMSTAAFWLAAVGTFTIVTGANAPSWPALIVGFALLGWGFGGFIPLQETIWGSYFGRRYLGAVRSVAMPFALFLGAGGPLAASYYVDFLGSYTGVFMTVAALWALGGAMVLLISRPRKPADPTLLEVLMQRPTANDRR